MYRWMSYGQNLQGLDVLWSVLKITKNNPFNVMMQMGSRLFVLHVVFPMVEMNCLGMNMAILA